MGAEKEGKEGRWEGGREGGEAGLYHADLKDTSSSSVTSHSLEYFECFMKVALSLWRLSWVRGEGKKFNGSSLIKP